MSCEWLKIFYVRLRELSFRTTIKILHVYGAHFVPCVTGSPNLKPRKIPIIPGDIRIFPRMSKKCFFLKNCFSP